MLWPWLLYPLLRFCVPDDPDFPVTHSRMMNSDHDVPKKEGRPVRFWDIDRRFGDICPISRLGYRFFGGRVLLADFGPMRTPVSESLGHPFRFYPDTDFRHSDTWNR